MIPHLVCLLSLHSLCCPPNLVHAPKPTGKGEMSKVIQQVKVVNLLIQNEVEMGNLQDDNGVDDSEGIDWPASDCEEHSQAVQSTYLTQVTNTPSTMSKVLIKQHCHIKELPKSCNQLDYLGLLLNIQMAFDPQAQAERTIFQSKITTLQAQLHDKQQELVDISQDKDKIIKGLHVQLLEDVRAHLGVQHELDMTKARLEYQEQVRTMMMGMGNMGTWFVQSMNGPPHPEAAQP
ncbi:hypothetical protein DACRYDRAFT_16845 [Dacryopinax primogenitus]|uniref:Uncharacterized protein n=1 Tax=Dacryopinax primogenitus (strain DJM 731) TaxID=1858805 RepID=M5FVJ9_DACPD|nr:uncharacterized protein DACRYDRAFT_16845 [Dacryopinax primogenitus]EJU00329.1 hypothetical protein DACRYDRAFT_16845 [Dacryopinax primogenitus]